MRLVPAYFLMLTLLTGVIAYQFATGNIQLENCDWRDAMAWLAFTLPGPQIYVNMRRLI